MRGVYDNGQVMIGNINNVINEVEQEIKDDMDMGFVDKEDLLKELKELKELGVYIVYIDYDSKSSGRYDLTYWYETDKVEEEI